MDIDLLRYPVGKFSAPINTTPEQRQLWIEEIKDLPALLDHELQGLSSNDLLKTYRPGGWNITQIVHHLADSHMNSFIRFKLALTEDHPTIKPYKEDKWGEMPDNKILDLTHSLGILKSLHYRWGFMLDHMTASDFTNAGYIHPDKGRIVPLNEVLALYAWHCRHHLAHIRNAKNS
jgi:hypothetical protein